MNPLERTFLFDWGSVLAPDDTLIAIECLAKKYPCNYEELAEVMRDEDDFSLSENYEGYIDRIQEHFGISREDIMDSKNRSRPNETFDFCHELKDKGFDLYLLSDQMQFRTDFIKENYDLSCFKQTFFSSEIGFVKKDKEAFLHVIKETGIDPKRTFFIDDSRENIKVAESVGFKGILYTDFESLKKDIGVSGAK